jgi:hypothetical protein
VLHYPHHGEQKARNSRENGKKGGRKRNPEGTQWVSPGLTQNEPRANPDPNPDGT